MKKKYAYLIIIFLIAATFVAFSQIASNNFINFDDDQYITKNNHIKSGINQKSIQWTFKAVVMGNWHPLTILSHMLDWSLFGANASGHHLVSLLLHIGAVIFLFLFLYKTTNHLWPAAFAAAFFALHPLRVESVAWASERKDVLSMFFGMATIYAYALYAGRYKFSRYFLCLILFALSLMSKPMLVTLPFVLLLLDYWPLGRWQKALGEQNKRFNSIGILIGEKIPFICLTVTSSIIALWAQNKAGATSFGDWLPFVMRSANAIVTYIDYLKIIFWPINLAVFYPYALSVSLWKVLIFAIILLVITLAVLYYIKKMPYLFTGWFWFLGTLIPVIGLVQVGMQAMADRYTYLPSIGISIMLAWGIPFLFQREYIRKKVLFPMGIATIAILTFLTWRQCGYWKNSVTLFNHTLKVTKDNYLAHQYLGMALYDEGNLKEAIAHYNMSIRLSPNYAEAFNNRGNAYAKLRQYQRAIDDYNKAIRLKQDYVEAYINRGVTYSILGQYQQAIENYNEAIRLKQDYVEAYHKRGRLYAKLGQNERAIEDYSKANLLTPDSANAYIERGIAYGERGQYHLAIKDFNEAIHLNSDNVEAYNYRGFTYSMLGNNQSAINDFNKAIRLKENYVEAYMNRGVAFLKQGNNTLGCRDVQKACALGNCKTLKSAQVIGLCR